MSDVDEIDLSSHPARGVLPRLAGDHAAASHRLEKFLDLWGAVHELVGPELERGVLDQLDEGDQETPGVGPVDDQPLKQHPGQKWQLKRVKILTTEILLQDLNAPGDLLLDGLRVSLSKQVEEAAGEVVGVGVGVPQLVGDAVQEQIPGEQIMF